VVVIVVPSSSVLMVDRICFVGSEELAIVVVAVLSSVVVVDRMHYYCD